MKQSQRLSDRENILNSHPFVVPKWMQHFQFQTLFTRFFPYFQILLPQVEKKFIKLVDGSQLAADCWFQEAKEKHKTIVLLSGFEGYQHLEVSRFVKSMSYKAYYYDFNVIHVKQRGEGDTIHLTKSVFNDYLDNDLKAIIKELDAWGIKKIYIAGFSAGAGIALLNTARLEHQEKHILGVVAISAPSNILGVWNHIAQFVPYNNVLLRSYKNLVKRRLAFDHPDTWDKAQLKKIKTKRQWFETYMHMWGYPEKFQSLEEYHKKTDLIPLLPRIHVPTLIIHAYDDPVSPITPFTSITNPNIITLLTKHGGHVGFFTTKKLYGDLDGHWAQNRAIEFFRLIF